MSLFAYVCFLDCVSDAVISVCVFGTYAVLTTVDQSSSLTYDEVVMHFIGTTRNTQQEGLCSHLDPVIKAALPAERRGEKPLK